VPPLFDPASYQFGWDSLPPLLTVGAVLVLGLGTLARERISLVSLSFLLITLAVSIWLFAQSWLYASVDRGVALWWARAAYAGVPFLGPAIYQFSLVIVRRDRTHRRALILAWTLAVLFAGAALGSDAVFGSLYYYAWGAYPHYRWLGVVFSLYLAVLLLTSMALYVRAYRRGPPGPQRRRVRALLIAFAVGYGGAIDLLPAYGVPLYPFGYLPILGFVALAARAIFVHRLVDITPAFAAAGIIETMDDALLVLDRHGVVRVANQAALRLFGTARAALLGQAIAEVLPDPLLADPEHFADSLVAGPLRDHELGYRTPSGAPRTLSLAATAMAGSETEPAAIVLIGRDVTVAKATAEQLRRQNVYLEALHETSLGLMRRLEPGDLLETVLQRAAALVGTAHGYIYVADPDGATLTAQAGIGVFTDRLGQQLRRGEGLPGRVWASGRPLVIDDDQRWDGLGSAAAEHGCHAVAGVPLNTGGQPGGVLGLAYLDRAHTFGAAEVDLLVRFGQLASIVLDNARLYTAAQTELAERTRAEAEIRRLNADLERRVAARTAELEAANAELQAAVRENARLYAEAQAAVRAREALLGVVSHDLRNLLAAVNGSVKLIQRYLAAPSPAADPGLVPHGLARIAAAAGKMNALIDEMLDFASLQAGQTLELHPRLTDLVALARQAAAGYQHTGDRHPIHIQAAAPVLAGLWDGPRLERVLDNLVSNAVKYSPQGGPIIIELRQEGAAPGWAVCVVRDRGIGIPAADRPYIFEWFRRASNVATHISGTGIGLASARQVVEQHHGEISVSSVEGAGSAFTVRLPLRPPGPPPNAPA